MDDLDAPVLPTLEEIDPHLEWSFLARLYWSAWMEDPVTGTWNKADVAMAADTIYLVHKSPSSQATEIRQRLTALGLTPFGRQQARLILPDDPRVKVVRGSPSDERPSTSPASQLPEAV
ncbi:MAG: hypothetical protein ACJ757_04850 [Gaiellaceae bacterium]